MKASPAGTPVPAKTAQAAANAGAQAAANAGAQTAAQAEAQAVMLANRLRKRFRHLKKWAARTGTDVFRLYDRDIPEIPLVLDWYGGSLAGALYKRPYEKDDAEERRWLALMKAAAAEALGIDGGRIFIKFRERQRGAAQYRRMAGGGGTDAGHGAGGGGADNGVNSGGGSMDAGAIREAAEGGLRFRVNLSDYLDTGLFPDRRRLRALILEEAAGKRVLNLFCYTASFSVYAASGGAAEIDSVDMSNTYLRWGRENFSLNGFKGVSVSETALRGTPLPPFRFIRADVLAFLPAAARAGRRWDLIILDPPAFSNSKKMRGALDIARDYPGLIRGALRLLNAGGRLWFSANARHFRLDPKEFRTAEFPSLRIDDMRARMIDEDFKGKKTPACYLFQV